MAAADCCRLILDLADQFQKPPACNLDQKLSSKSEFFEVVPLLQIP